MSNLYNRKQLNTIFKGFNIPFSSGQFYFVPGLHIGVNKYNLGLDGVDSNGNTIDTDFGAYFGHYNKGSAVRSGVGIFKDDYLGFSRGGKIVDESFSYKKIHLDGGADYYYINDNTALSITGSMSITVSFILDAIGKEQTIIGKWYENGQVSYRLYISASNRLVFAISTDGSAEVEHTGTVTTFSAGTVYHVTAAYSPSTYMDIFVNNIRDATQKTTSVPASIYNSTSALYVGCKKNGVDTLDTFFDGKVSDIKIYNIAFTLNQAKIAAYSRYDYVKRTTCIAHWRFNDDGNDSIGANALTPVSISASNYETDNIAYGCSYSSCNPQSGTISFWLYPFWDGSDTKKYYILDINSSGQYLKIYKDTDSKFTFEISNGTDTTIWKTTSALTWTSGTWHHVCCLFTRNPEDSSTFIKVYLDNVSAGTITGNAIWGLLTAAPSTFYLGNNSGYGIFTLEGILSNFSISNVIFKDTIANARTAGMFDWQSIEYLYNTGSSNRPIVDENNYFWFFYEEPPPAAISHLSSIHGFLLRNENAVECYCYPNETKDGWNVTSNSLLIGGDRNFVKIDSNVIAQSSYCFAGTTKTNVIGFKLRSSDNTLTYCWPNATADGWDISTSIP